MKKTVAILMGVILLFSLGACSNGNKEEAPEIVDASSEKGSESLVVYFSRSGNTENVAKSIQSQTNSDIFELVPVTPYSDDYDTVADVAQEEQSSNARPAISETIENIQQYDVIYVGFPKIQYGFLSV